MKQKKGLSYLVLLLALIFVLAGCSKAAGSQKKTIRIVTTGVSFPGSYKKDNQLQGFDVDVAKAAAKKIGYQVEFKTTSFDGLFGQLQSNKVDAVASNITITPERQQQFYFSKPYGYFKSAVVVSKQSSLTALQQLKNKTIAATVGSIQIQQLKKLSFPTNVKTYDDREGALNAVINQQTVGYSNARAILAALIKQKKLPLKILKGDFAPERIALTFNKNSQGKKLQKKFNQALGELQKDGMLARLSKKYFSGVDVSHE